MRVIVRDPKIFQTLRPLDIASYLRANGWKQVEKRESTAIWALGEEEIILPFDTGFADYAHRIADIIRTLSTTEQRSELEIIRDISTVSADVIRFRLAKHTDHFEEIPIDTGVLFAENVRETIMAAACSALAPKRYFPSRKPDIVMDYLRKVRIAPADRGSYVITVISPVPTALVQSSLFSDEPFERKVTKILAQSLNILQEAANRAASDGTIEFFIEGVKFGISANLCEALAIIVDNSAAQLDIDFVWSKIRPEHDVKRKYSLVPDMVPYLLEAARVLRETAVLEDYDLEGVVVRLERGPGETRGRATVFGFVEGVPRRVVVEPVNEEEYSVLIDAFRTRKPISCRGELTREGRRYVLKNTRLVSVAEDQQE